MGAPTMTTITLMAFHFLGIVALSTSSCHTVYGKTSRSSVPTRTSTSTYYVGPTHTLESGTFTHTGPIYFSTSTVTEYYTFFSMIGERTTTLPLPSGFTPLISAKSVTATPKSTSTTKTKKNARRATASKTSTLTSYAQSVQCTQSTTKTGQTITTPATTITVTPLTDFFTITTSTTVSATTHVATATEFEACQPSVQNILNEFDGHSIVDWAISQSDGLLDFTLPYSCEFGSGDCQYTGDAQKSPADCCYAVMMFGLTAPEINYNYGFAYYQEPGQDPTCRSFAAYPAASPGPATSTMWNFTLGTGHPDGLFVGNGPNGQPYYIAST